MLSDDIKEEGDIHLLYEDQFIELIDTKKYDVIIADKTFKKAIKDYKGLYIEIPHFAVSGEWW